MKLAHKIRFCRVCKGTENLFKSQNFCRDCNRKKAYNEYLRKKNLPKEIKYSWVYQDKKKNPEKYKERMKKWKEKNPNYGKEYHINNKHKWIESKRVSNRKRLYGITQEQYNEILLAQDSNCGICGINQSQMKRQLAVDHNHTTKKVRGLLCATCNLALGYLKENVRIITNMKKYIEKYET